MNKKNIAIFILGAILFLLPQMVQSSEEIFDTHVVIIPDSFQDNGNLTDQKTQMIIRVTSAPTNMFTGGQDMIYNDKVIVDISKPNTWDNKVINSLKLKESNFGRNLTKITWFDGKQIYP